MASKEINKIRLKIISDAIHETGNTKKKTIIEYIRSNRENDRYFNNITDRRFYDLISFDPDQDILDEGHLITGRSILKNSKGEITAEWVKTTIDKDNQLQGMQSVMDEMKKDIKPYKPVPAPKKATLAKLCNQYTVTDYHMGMMAWAEETGDDWNIRVAEKIIIKWFEQAISTAPRAAKAIFANIGDFMHFDGLEAVTPSSGHVLDADVRYQNLVRISIRVIRKVIQMLLVKYKEVHLIMAEGNHDLASSAWLRETFNMYFENEPRLIVDTNPDPYYCFTWGKVCLFFHHSHKKNIKQLDAVFVSKFKKEFGQSKHVYGHTGHYHHEIKLESNLMIMEQHSTLAAKDAHSSRGGYSSVRNSKVITYHKEFGEVHRSTINPDMLK